MNVPRLSSVSGCVVIIHSVTLLGEEPTRLARHSQADTYCTLCIRVQQAATDNGEHAKPGEGEKTGRDTGRGEAQTRRRNAQ